MRQLSVVAPRQLEWIDVPPPVLQLASDVLVRPTAVTLCDLDRPMVTGSYPVPLPIALGHEFVADVVSVGDEVVDIAPGQRVVVPFQISCGNCENCQRGFTAHCESVPTRSQYGFGESCGTWGGGFADLVRVPYGNFMLQRVPDHVSSASVAAAGDNLGDGYRCVAPHLSQMPGARVVIFGGIGSVPLYAAMFAVALGAHTVDYVDNNAARRDIAGRVGANAMATLFADRTSHYDIAVDGTLFDPSGLSTAFGSVRTEGIVVGATIYLKPPTIPYLNMYLSGAHFHTGRVHARTCAPEVIAMVASGSVDPMLVTGAEILPFDEADTSILESGVKPVYIR
jgi:threonine dehydrogenase-like Zn-dependent dehydrogenase